jgi:CBS domain-containing protein
MGSTRETLESPGAASCGRDADRRAVWAMVMGAVADATEASRDSLAVKDVMTTEVVTIRADASLAYAARVLTDRKIGCLPVVENGRLVGILTEGDFVALVARGDQ